MTYITNSASTCDKCKSLNECTAHCETHIGHALYNFLKSISVIDSTVGSFSHSKYDEEDYMYTIIGHTYYEDCSRSDLLRLTANALIDKNETFSRFNNMTAMQVLSSYINKMHIDEIDDVEPIIQKLSGIQNTQKIILPFVPGNMYAIHVDVDGETKQIKRKIVSLTFKFESNNVQTLVHFDQGSKNSPIRGITYSVDEYMQRFFMDTKISSEKYKPQECIKMSNRGYIKPICVQEVKTCVIVDGTYIYSLMDSMPVIIGHWEGNKMVMSKRSSDNIMKFLKDHQDIINKHRGYIAPYGLVEPNVVIC